MNMVQKMVVETNEKPPRRGVVVASASEWVDGPEGRELVVLFAVNFPDEKTTKGLVEFFDNEDLTPIAAYDTADELAVHTCPKCDHEFRTEDELEYEDDDGEEEEESEEELEEEQEADNRRNPNRAGGA